MCRDIWLDQSWWSIEGLAILALSFLLLGFAASDPHSKGWKQLAVGFALFGLLILAAAHWPCAAEPSAAGPLVDLGGFASWVQAVGTLVAIAVAFYVGRSDIRTRQEERKDVARALAVELYLELVELDVQVKNLEGVIDDEGMHPATAEEFLVRVANIHIEIPPGLRQQAAAARPYFLMNLLEPGAGTSVVQLAAVLGQHARLAATAPHAPHLVQRNPIPTMHRLFGGHVRMLATLTREAKAKVAKIHSTVIPDPTSDAV